MHSSRLAWVVVSALATAACGPTSANGPALSTPAGWVQRGVDQFRAATAVDVLPGAAGEGSCAEVQPSCGPYTLTQTSSTAPTASAQLCRSIPACAGKFFTPIVSKLSFARSDAVDRVTIDGDPGCVEGAWCSWSMELDRETGNILAVDIHVGGGTHDAWPTYAFRNYRVRGSMLNTPTAAPAPPPTPPLATGMVTVAISGDLQLTASRLAGNCFAQPGTTPDGFDFIHVSGPIVTAPSVHLMSVDFSPTAFSSAATAAVQVYPAGSTGFGSPMVLAYDGPATSTPVGNDVWQRTVTGTLPRRGYTGSVTITATIDCG